MPQRPPPPPLTTARSHGSPHSGPRSSPASPRRAQPGKCHQSRSRSSAVNRWPLHRVRPVTRAGRAPRGRLRRAAPAALRVRRAILPGLRAHLHGGPAGDAGTGMHGHAPHRAAHRMCRRPWWIGLRRKNASGCRSHDAARNHLLSRPGFCCPPVRAPTARALPAASDSDRTRRGSLKPLPPIAMGVRRGHGGSRPGL
ncbi:MAG: hypothetical protein JWL98_147 [Xanthomonadaceae bacterium]|nr:hypothetical protein [Xanthomonadaceae bacterium]